jgi:hypothetical protein
MMRRCGIPDYIERPPPDLTTPDSGFSPGGEEPPRLFKCRLIWGDFTELGVRGGDYTKKPMAAYGGVLAA